MLIKLKSPWHDLQEFNKWQQLKCGIKQKLMNACVLNRDVNFNRFKVRKTVFFWGETAGSGFICAACHKVQQISGFPSSKFSCYCMRSEPGAPARHSIISDKQPFHKTSPKFVFALFTRRAWRQVVPQQMAEKASFFHRLLIRALTRAHL